jgi:hypothetical protein
VTEPTKADGAVVPDPDRNEDDVILDEAVDDSEVVTPKKSLGLSRVGTLTQMVGKEAAEPTLKRIENNERKRAAGIRSLGLASWSR